MSAQASAGASGKGPRVGVAILGAGRLAAELTWRLQAAAGPMRLELVAGLAPDSDGLRTAQELGIDTSTDGVNAVLSHPQVQLVFDATGARAHARNARALRDAGKLTVDLTPSAAGPIIVPAVNLPAGVDGGEVCLVSSAAQAAVPVACAVSRAARTSYVEVVTTVASSTLGRGARLDVDELTAASARALEGPGGARRAKAILIVTPADPAPLMRCILYAVLEAAFDEPRVRESIEQMVGAVQRYAPGYRLRRDPEVLERDTARGRKPVLEATIEVEGLRRPHFAGNLELMASAAERVGDRLARLVPRASEVVA